MRAKIVRMAAAVAVLVAALGGAVLAHSAVAGGASHATAVAKCPGQKDPGTTCWTTIPEA